MRVLIVFLAAFVCSTAQVEFVGVMSNSKETLFAVRDGQSAKSRWVSVGDQVAGFVVLSYDPKADTLTLKRSNERIVLKLPDSRVQMARDEVVNGLARIFGNSNAERMSDLLHPKLRALFKAEDLDSGVFRDILSPAAKVELREIPAEFARGLEDSLAEVERAVGVRPTHGLWIRAKGLSMSFLVKVGDTWFLAPSVPRTSQ